MKKSSLIYTIVSLVIIMVVFGCAAEVVNEPTAQPVQPVQYVQPAAPAESCTDGIQNQDETGIDCGGKCASCVQEVVEIPSATPQPAPKPEMINYAIPADKLTQLKAQLTISTKSIIYPNAYPSGLSVGDSYVFPFGLTNTYMVTEQFKYEVRFVSANDFSNSVIQDIDPQIILTWFDNNKFQENTLAKYEQVFFPIGVTVGKEIASGVKTVPGNYNFAFVSYFLDSSVYNEYDLREFSFKVK
jgi:hypothetical protein